MHVKTGDEVLIITGKDKGKRGKVLKVLADDRLVVGGLNLVKRHTKPNPMSGVQGGIVEKEAPLHASNVAIFGVPVRDASRISRFNRRPTELAFNATVAPARSGTAVCGARTPAGTAASHTGALI